MYDSFSSDYDRFVNWTSRLAYELPFIERQLQVLAGQAPARVLDAACGTGMHAIALAQKGYQAAGADLSAGMIARARENAASMGVNVQFETAGFGWLAQAFGPHSFDALLCLGNSLPHLLSARDLALALSDFAACLRPGGILIVQNRNFDAVMAGRERWMEPQAHREGDSEWVFVRFYDYEPDGLIRFNILTLTRFGGGSWNQQGTATLLRPLLKDELETALSAAGFSQIEFYGDLTGSPFDKENSGNLIAVAKS